MSEKNHAWLKRIGVSGLLLLKAVLAPAQQSAKQIARISFYSDAFHKRLTANGERYHKDSFTAAHHSFPFDTWLQIKNPKNGRTVVVRVNDRCGSRKCILDVSGAAAKTLGMIRDGVISAQVEVVGYQAALALRSLKDTVSGTAKQDELVRKEAPAAGRYKVQVGAFRDRNNVARAKEKLLNAGFRNVEISAAPLYRLFVGPFKTQGEARKMLQSLKKKKFEGKVIRG